MKYSRNEILTLMNDEIYPLSSKYDPDWILNNAMGSHCLWLQEALCQSMHLKEGMRVLDMGCGKAISSIFLAKEFGVRVWANDLWIGASDNWQRICEMGAQDNICPIHADANDLPYAEYYFDALVSINSIFFYAKDSDYLREHLLKLIKPDGEIGIIVPGFVHEYADGLPDAYKPYADSFGLNNWHTPDWWKKLFEQTGIVDVILADNLSDNKGKELYQKTMKIFNAHEEPFNMVAWDDMTFIRIIAKRKA